MRWAGVALAAPVSVLRLLLDQAGFGKLARMRTLILALAIATVAGVAGAVPPNPNASRPPNDPLARELVQVEADIKRGDFAAALPKVERITALDSDFADAWAVQGFTLRRLGRRDEAYTAYRRALALDPGNRPATAYLGELFLESRDIEGARALAERLKELCPYGCPEAQALNQAIAAYR